MKLLLLTLTLLAAGTPAMAQETTRRLDVPTTVFLAGATLDNVTTQMALRRGGFRETNPLLGFARNDPNAIGVAAVFTDTATVWTANRLLGKHPVARNLLLYGMASLRLSVGVRNVREMRR